MPYKRAAAADKSGLPVYQPVQQQQMPQQATYHQILQMQQPNIVPVSCKLLSNSMLLLSLMIVNIEVHTKVHTTLQQPRVILQSVKRTLKNITTTLSSIKFKQPKDLKFDIQPC